MRLFIAINLPDRSKDLLLKKIDKIRKSVDQNLKWVNQNNLHLTLKFLGETDEKQITFIKDALTKIRDKYNSFPVQFNKIGAFPNLKYPRVFFVNIIRGNKKLIEIHNILEKQLVNKEFNPDKKNYKPHLTLARSRKRTDLSQLAETFKKFSDENFINIYMQADKISLIESKLLPSGPEYEEIFSISLG